MNPSGQHWMPRTKHMLSGREAHHLRPKCRQNSGKCKTFVGRRRQHYSDTHKAKQFFNAIKTVYGPSISGFFPLLSFDGSSLIRTRKDSTLLNRPSTVAKVVLQHVSQQPVMEGLNQPPTTDKGKKASPP